MQVRVAVCVHLMTSLIAYLSSRDKELRRVSRSSALLGTSGKKWSKQWVKEREREREREGGRERRGVFITVLQFRQFRK